MPKKPKAPSTKPKENIVGENIRYLLKQRDMTIKALAKRIGVFPKTAYFWVAGYNVPDSVSRQKLCDFFAITEAQLFSKGLAVGTQTAEATAIHEIIVKLGLEGVAPDDLLRLSEKDKELIKDLIKRLSGQRSQQARETIAEALGDKAHRKCILLVDDEARLCEALSLKLKEIGYRVYIAGDGSEGLQRVKEHKPDLILMDLKMVGMDGTEFLRKFRQEDSKTKVIVTSAFPDEIAELYAENLQIEGYIEKPVTLEFLLDQIEKAIGGPT